MPRNCDFLFTADAGLFDPLQLHPAAAGHIAFNAGTRWLREHLVSHRALLSEHRTGLAVWSARLRYERPLRFADADELRVRAVMKVRHGGGQVQCDVGIGSGSDRSPLMPAPAVRASLVLIPLRIGGGPALGGTPAVLGQDLLARFRPDERLPSVQTSPVPRLRRALPARPQARTRTRFLIGRHMCEMADQWFWPTALSLAATGREGLIRRHTGVPGHVRDGLRRPVRIVDVLLERPFYLFDRGVVVSSAWARAEGPVFVHELRSGRSRHGVVVEQW
ncbi:hypothetical protein [Sinosporangium siamense]|uniref:Uncharacterized protein n=1 Tax=Sinosporangium siamense TaxID=1367973 RepID=A0A919RN05_9ACTN|nr:hypothetical protein [Sinosporangium siamense]GII96771.1 hypothetical protein Ssi02_70020 [Sinosporangium siamense]